MEVRDLINDHRFEKRYRIKEASKLLADVTVPLEHELSRKGF